MTGFSARHLKTLPKSSTLGLRVTRFVHFVARFSTDLVTKPAKSGHSADLGLESQGAPGYVSIVRRLENTKIIGEIFA